MLHDVLAQHRPRLIDEVMKRMEPHPTNDAFAIGLPLFLDRLGEALRGRESAGESSKAAVQHLMTLHRVGFTVSQIVYGYRAVGQVVTGLAIELDDPVSAHDNQILNLCLDATIAEAVTELGRLREQSLVAAGNARVESMAQELHKLLGGALASFDLVRAGRVAIGGSTGALLGRSLSRLQSIAERAIAETRIDSGLPRDEIPIAELVKEMVVVAQDHAKAGAVQLRVDIVAPGATVLGDRPLLATALNGLVENAIRFTPMEEKVTVTSNIDGALVVIDVADECGGLENDDVERLFARPEERGPNHNGLGLGLGLMRRAVRAMGGEIAVRNIVGRGCVFTLRMPLAS